MQLLSLKQTIDKKITRKAAPLLSPKTLGRIANMCPFGFNKQLISYFLNYAFAEQVADGDFEFLQENSLLIEIIDAKCFIGISYQLNQLVCDYFDSVTTPSNATLSIRTFDAIQLIEQSVDPDTLFFQRKLKISGDTELAHQAKNTIDTLDQKRIPSALLKLVSLYKLQLDSTS
jgi:predicted lipid carrier protein YhbT